MTRSDKSKTFSNKFDEINNCICEALGCYEKAAKQIELSAGKFGTISLSVCKKCSRKFMPHSGDANDR